MNRVIDAGSSRREPYGQDAYENDYYGQDAYAEDSFERDPYQHKGAQSSRKRKSKSKGSILINIAIVLAALGAISLALYPTIANWINQLTQDQNIVIYNTVVQNVDTSGLDEMWDAAKAFNDTIAEQGSLFQLTDAEKEEYNNLLNINRDGVIGYVDIPEQNIHLPVYHGTEDEVLETAVGHLEGTSLPTDGESVHCTITGHTGLPTLDLFTDIRKMEIGDTFTVTVLNRILSYTVDQIDVVLPEDLYDLRITEGENYCTLITCTPYGVNDHRLLVRGTLTDVEVTGTTQDTQRSYVVSGGYNALNNIVLTISILLIVAAIVILIWITVMYYRCYHK